MLIIIPGKYGIIKKMTVGGPLFRGKMRCRGIAVMTSLTGDQRVISMEMVVMRDQYMRSDDQSRQHGKK